MMTEGKVGLDQEGSIENTSTHNGIEMTVIKDVPNMQHFTEKPKHVSYLGARPMHKTTMGFGNRLGRMDYASSYKHYYTGKSWDGKQLSASTKSLPYPSMHLSDLDLSMSEDVQYTTQFNDAFSKKDVIPHYILHRATTKNKMHNTEGTALKQVTNQETPQDYETSYSSTFPCRPSYIKIFDPEFQLKRHAYNIITGEVLSAAPTKKDYRRKSGDFLQKYSRKRGCIYDQLELY